MGLRSGVKGLGFQRLGCRVWGSSFEVQGLGHKVWAYGCSV